MERKILLVSIFITFGFIAFLSGRLLVASKDPSSQSGSLIERFNNKEEGKHNVVLTTTPLSNRKIISFVSSVSNPREITAVDKNGNVVKIDTSDLREVLLAKLSPKDMTEAILSPDGSLVLYSFYDTDNKKYVRHNLKTGESTEIGQNIKSTAFSLNNNLAYLSNNGDEGKLYLFKEGKAKELLSTRLTNASVSWPSDFLSLTSYDKNGYGELFVLKDDGKLNKIISYQKNLNVRWSPSSQKLLFSSKDASDVTHLYYRKLKEGEVLGLDVEADVSKCIWLADEISIVCGVKNNSSFRDEFYKISLIDGSKNLVATPSTNLIAKEVAVSPSEDTIFVLNELDDKLYSLKMK